MTNDLVIAMTLEGLMIGRKKEGKQGFYLQDPRICVVVQNDKGQTGIVLQHIPGNPNMAFIPSVTVHFTNNDDQLEAAYIRSTSNIVLASTGN